MNANLIRFDPEKHMNRRYSVFVQPTLLDPVAVVCVWGSRRSGYQRMQVHVAATLEEACTIAGQITRAKVHRGYLSVD